MSSLLLFDDERRGQLLPLTFTKPVAALRIGIDLISEKWESELESKAFFITENYLSGKFTREYTSLNLYINGGILPDAILCAAIKDLHDNESLTGAFSENGNDNTEIIAFRSSAQYTSFAELKEGQKKSSAIQFKNEYISVRRPWHLFQYNDKVLRDDFIRLTKNKTTQTISSSYTILGDAVFLEEGASVEASTINSKTGPVFIAKNAEVMEGSLLRGPLYIGENATVKMGAKIYGATTIGPHCKVGGEISNSIITGYSNKAHDGFLGNSVIGEWCNLGADTNNSNLKNNYADVRLWDYPTRQFISTGLQFCGLIMGDHSKCGINTMFNTGTVVGVNANIFGAGFPRNFIPGFSWGGAAGFTTYKLEDALKVASEVMQRRSIHLSDEDKKILAAIFEMEIK